MKKPIFLLISLSILFMLSLARCATPGSFTSPTPASTQIDIQGTLITLQQTQTALAIVTPTFTETPSPVPTSTPPLLGTLTIKTTPRIPAEILSLFQSSVTPNPDAIFSSLIFTQGINPATYEPLNPAEVFQNPVGHLFALFTYDGMVPESQWTALWFYNGTLVHYETKPWDGGTGGYGYTDWNPNPLEWKPGEYEVHIFVGQQWKVSGRFTVEGEPSSVAFTATAMFTESPTPSNTPTVTPTAISTATSTRPPTATATVLPPSYTPTPTLSIASPFPAASPTFTASPLARTVTNTPSPSPVFTVTPSATLRPTGTPTATITPSATPVPPSPTFTLTATASPSPAFTRVATATPTKRPTVTPITITPTITRHPTATPVTPTPTYTRRPTLTSAP